MPGGIRRQIWIVAIRDNKPGKPCVHYRGKSAQCFLALTPLTVNEDGSCCPRRTRHEPGGETAQLVGDFDLLERNPAPQLEQWRRPELLMSGMTKPRARIRMQGQGRV